MGKKTSRVCETFKRFSGATTLKLTSRSLLETTFPFSTLKTVVKSNSSCFLLFHTSSRSWNWTSYVVLLYVMFSTTATTSLFPARLTLVWSWTACSSYVMFYNDCWVLSFMERAYETICNLSWITWKFLFSAKCKCHWGCSHETQLQRDREHFWTRH